MCSKISHFAAAGMFAQRGVDPAARARSSQHVTFAARAGRRDRPSAFEMPGSDVVRATRDRRGDGQVELPLAFRERDPARPKQATVARHPNVVLATRRRYGRAGARAVPFQRIVGLGAVHEHARQRGRFELARRGMIGKGRRAETLERRGPLAQRERRARAVGRRALDVRGELELFGRQQRFAELGGARAKQTLDVLEWSKRSALLQRRRRVAASSSRARFGRPRSGA